MIGVRLNFVVEGQTEETFVNRLLGEHLAQRSIWVFARRVTTSRKEGKKHRGGLVTYDHARRDISRWLKQEQEDNVRVTTLFDLYGLPNDFPGYAEAQQTQDPYKKVDILERALGNDISDWRFIPYFQLHEFEALLFCDPLQLGRQFDQRDADFQKLVHVATDFGNPELINDHPNTAPSKRIISAIPAYVSRKAAAGPIVAQYIGLHKLRNDCWHFGRWVDQLEALARPSFSSDAAVAETDSKHGSGVIFSCHRSC